MWVLKGKMPNKQGPNVKKIPKKASRWNSTNGGTRKVFQQIRNTSHGQVRPQFKYLKLRDNLQKRKQWQRQERPYFQKQQVGKNLNMKNDSRRNVKPAFINKHVKRILPQQHQRPQP